MSVKTPCFARRVFQTARLHFSVTTFSQRLTATALVLTFSLFMIMQTVVAGSGLTGRGKNVNPFQPYQAVMPGRPTQGLKPYTCGLTSATSTGVQLLFNCQKQQNNQRLWLKEVGIGGGVILYLSLNFERLRFGELVQRWGQPDYILKMKQSCLVQWHDGMYASLAPCSPSLLLANVDQVTFTRR